MNRAFRKNDRATNTVQAVTKVQCLMIFFSVDVADFRVLLDPPDCLSFTGAEF